MPASTDNYTKLETIRPLFAEVRYTTEVDYDQSYSGIVVLISPTTYLNLRISKLLNEFALLKDNWDEGDALAPNLEALTRARYITSLLGKRGQSIFHTAPGPNGEIMLDLRNDRMTKSLEIIFYSERAVVVYFPKEGRPIQRDFNVQHLPSHIEWLNNR